MGFLSRRRQLRNDRRNPRTPFVLPPPMGWNDNSNNAALQPGDLALAENIQLERANLPRSRYGTHRDPYEAELNSGAAINFLIDFKATKDTILRPIVIAGDTIFVEDASGTPSVGVDITNGNVVTAGQDLPFTSTFFKDRLILAQFGNTTGAVPIAIPAVGDAVPLSQWFGPLETPSYVHTQFNFLFFAGFDGSGIFDPMTVVYGELNDDGTFFPWDSANVIDKIGGLSAFGDEFVTGLFPHRDFLMIGTNRRIFPVAYTGNRLGRFAIQRPIEVGLAHQNAVASINGEFTFFMDVQGQVHTVRDVVGNFGDVGIQSVSRKVSNYLQNLDRGRVKFAQMRYWEEEGLIVTSVTSAREGLLNNEILVLDVNEFPLNEPDWRAAKWFRWTGLPANYLAIQRRNLDLVTNTSNPDIDGSEYMTFGTTTGFVKRMTPAISYDEDDAGVQQTIRTRYRTKAFDFDVPNREKSVVEGYWWMQPVTALQGPNATWIYDFGQRTSNVVEINLDTGLNTADTLGFTFVLGESKLGGQNATAMSKDFFNGAGQVAALDIDQTIGTTQVWKLQQATAVVELRGDAPEGF